MQLAPAGFNPGATRNAAANEEYLIYFTARFIGHRLIIDIQFKCELISRLQVQRLTDRFVKTLNYALNNEVYLETHSHLEAIVSNLPTVGLPVFNPVIGFRPTKVVSEKTVLLTGCTGFLGVFLLKELLSENNIKVICLVKASSDESATERVKNLYRHFFESYNDRLDTHLQIISGDLTCNDFGVDTVTYKWLKDQTDLVIHAAANTNLLKTYKELRGINVESINQMVSFAGEEGGKELHYISSMAVSGYTDQSYRTFSEDDFDSGQRFLSDYERSKFDAEQVIRRYFNNGGKGKIYRMGHIAADSTNAIFQMNANKNRIFQILNGIRLLRMIPGDYNETVSFSFVDIVARGIVSSCLHLPEELKDCLHIENPQKYSFLDLADRLSDTHDRIKKVSLAKFKQAVLEFTGSEEDIELVNATLMWVERFYRNPRNVSYLQGYTVDQLALRGIYFPAISRDWLMAMLKQENESFIADVPYLYDQKFINGSEPILNEI